MKANGTCPFNELGIPITEFGNKGVGHYRPLNATGAEVGGSNVDDIVCGALYARSPIQEMC